MAPRPRVLTAVLAVLATAAVASAASAASYSYDAGTDVLQVRAGAGETLHIAATGPNGQYLLSGTDGNNDVVQWTDQNIAGILPFSVGGPPPTAAGLTVQAAHPGAQGPQVALARIELTDDTGPANFVVEGGTDAYMDPILVDPVNVLSTVRLKDMSGGAPIDFGTTSLTINAPSISIENDISSAGRIVLASPAPISLGKAIVSLAAATSLQTTTINGNGKSLEMHGPWRAAPMTGSSTAVTGVDGLMTEGSLEPRGDIAATTGISIGSDVQVPAGSSPTITAPWIITGGITAAPAACGVAGVQGCDVQAAGLPTGITLATPRATIRDAVTLNGAVAISQDAWTGTTRIRGGVDQPGGSFEVGGALLPSGTDAMTIRTGLLYTGGGMQPDAGGCEAARITCGSIDEAVPRVATRSVTVDAGVWATDFTAYMPGALTATGPVVAASPRDGRGNSNASLQSDGPLDLRGGVQVPVYGAMTVQGAPTTLAGVTPAVQQGSVDGADDACNPGPLLAIGDLRVTAPIECLSTLMTSGSTWLAADVHTQAHQAYDGPVTVALGDGPRHLQAGGLAGIGFHQGVAAAWGPTPGDVGGYRASAGASACATDAATFQCALDPVPGGNDLVFSVDAMLNQAAAPAGAAPAPPKAGSPLPSGRTTRRSVGKGSRTPLATLIVPPKSRGKRTWAERGPCRIVRGRLVAPAWKGTCTVTLRVARSGRTRAWRGRAIVDVA